MLTECWSAVELRTTTQNVQKHARCYVTINCDMTETIDQIWPIAIVIKTVQSPLRWTRVLMNLWVLCKSTGSVRGAQYPEVVINEILLAFSVPCLLELLTQMVVFQVATYTSTSQLLNIGFCEPENVFLMFFLYVWKTFTSAIVIPTERIRAVSW